MRVSEASPCTAEFKDRATARRALASLSAAELVGCDSVTAGLDDRPDYYGKYAELASQVLAAMEERDERYGGLRRMHYDFGLQELLLMVERSVEPYAAFCRASGRQPSLSELRQALLRGDVHKRFMELKEGPAKTFETHYGLRGTDDSRIANFVFADRGEGLMFTVDDSDWLRAICEAGTWEIKASGNGLCAAHGKFGNDLWAEVVKHAATRPDMLAADLAQYERETL